MDRARFSGRTAFGAATELARLLLPIALIAWGGTVALEAGRQFLASGEVSARVLWMAPAQWADLIPLGAMLLFVVLEWLARGRDAAWTRGLFRRSRYDLFFAIADNTGMSRILGLVFSLGLSSWLISTAGALTFSPRIAAWPMAAQVVLIYVVGSFCVYWAHRLMHTRLMWPLHALHHSARHMTALTNSRQHPLDQVILGVPAGAVLILIGFSPEAMFAASLPVGVQVALQHSAVPFPLWVERWLISGPRTHRIHHSIAAEHHDHNFGLLVVWDRLFGTFLLPKDTADLPTGVDDAAYDGERPLVAMVEVTRLWLRHLAQHAYQGP